MRRKKGAAGQTMIPVATIAPVAPLPLAYGRGDVAVVVGVLLEP
jgi:hypothetical protein